MSTIINDGMIMKTQFIVIMCMMLMLSACGGGGAKVESTNTTMGQELMDLDESFKKGLITEKEYNSAKKNILKRYN